MRKLVIIGMVFPEPESTAAGKRMMQLIEAFLEQNFSITFLSTALQTENGADLDSKNIASHRILVNDSSFDELITELSPDVVMFDRYITEEQFGWRITENCPNALKILDTEDLHFLRNARRKAFHEGRTVTESDLVNDIFKREIASIYRSDLSLIISEFEYELLQEKFSIPKELLFYMPFLTDKSHNAVPGFEERRHFVSIGNFLHEPNWQTVLRIKKLWPEIRKNIPGAEVHIYGAYASEKVLNLHDEQSGFLIKGRADSSAEIFNSYRVLLAPIPFGASLKGKLWESMLYGLPNVTSSVGAEAMNGRFSWNGFIEDDDGQFIEKCCELYQNSNTWTKSQAAGFTILQNRYCRKQFLPQFFEKIRGILNNLSDHRNRNFMGQILQHHQLNSLKYMSRWIEEKNRKQ